MKSSEIIIFFPSIEKGGADKNLFMISNFLAKKLDKVSILTCSNKHKIKFKTDRVRGTSPAELRSSGPKLRPERVASTLGVEGESIRRDVPDNDNVFNDKTISDDYKSGGAYKAILKLFAEQLDDDKFAEHCRKFFKGSGDTSGPAQTVTQQTKIGKTNE